MKKKILAALMAASSLYMAAAPAPVDAHKALFPNTGYSWVGDTMPFYDGENFRIFYLEDLRDGDTGFHPWSLFTTKDFTDYKYNGIVIPYDKKDDFAKDSALGTGSVVKDKDGLYHAFYTGFNWRTSPKETIMHAVSRDMVNWQKLPEDSFIGDDKTFIIGDTFRDPNVFYNEDYNEYWMLITTRSKKARGVIGLYTSKDLKTWENQGILFDNDMGTDSNMECPTLLKHGDYWYLTFSDQWPNRVVHYRMAKDSKGPFEKPARDYFDASGFYAGKLAQDNDNNLYLVGWTPTKWDKSDNKPTDWAGNMVSHQLKQNSDGTLYPTPIDKVVDRLQTQKEINTIVNSEGVLVNGNSYTFSGQGSEKVVMSRIEGMNKITGKFTVKDGQGIFGLMFNVTENETGSLNLVFDPQKKQVGFYNTDTNRVNKKGVNPEWAVPVDIKAGESYEFTLLIDDTVAVLYINDEMALSTRMYNLPKNNWGVFSENEAVTLSDLQMATY